MGRNMFGRVAQAFDLSGISFRPPLNQSVTHRFLRRGKN
jgi:hypothetical protein